MNGCWLRSFVLLVIAFSASACAGYRIEKDGQGCGYDVYRPEPYVKMTPKSAGVTGKEHLFYYDCEIIWLPNYSQRYRVSSWAGLGKADFQFTFTDGWKLTQVNDKSDNSNILTEIMGLVKHVLPADPFDIKSEQTKSSEKPGEFLNCQPIIYRIDFDAHGRPTCLSQLNVQLLSCDPCGKPTPLGVEPRKCPKSESRHEGSGAAGTRGG
jgi:hypothetical protein